MLGVFPSPNAQNADCLVDAPDHSHEGIIASLNAMLPKRRWVVKEVRRIPVPWALDEEHGGGSNGETADSGRDLLGSDTAGGSRGGGRGSGGPGGGSGAGLAAGRLGWGG